jgi:hypothetical protein
MIQNGSGPTSTAIEEGAQKSDQLTSKIDSENNAPANTNQAQLIGAIKAHIAAGDKHTSKAKDHYIAAGQYLAALKKEHTGTWAEWEALLRTKVGIGKSRASELMQIADGCKTVEGVAADRRKRQRDAKVAKNLSVDDGDIGVTHYVNADGEHMVGAVLAPVSKGPQRTYSAEPPTITIPADESPQVPLDANPICHAWRLASNEERAEFVHLFADDLRRLVDDHHQDEDGDPAVAEAAKSASEERRAAEEKAFADKLANRPPPNLVERAEIEKARKRTQARTPSIAMNIEDRGAGGRSLYADHSDEEGHQYRLADTFGTRSLQFVHSMLNGLGDATANHSLDYDFNPGRPNQVAFNAALAVISGVRPKDEIEAMLAAHMAVTNIVLPELVARTRGAVAGHRYEGNGIKRLDVLGNLTTKFMRTYTMQVEALARKRRKGQQNIRVKHVHVYAGGQAVVGAVSHRGGRGHRKK